eukprot:6938151-Pyramimonas_sp.AAC.1
MSKSASGGLGPNCTVGESAPAHGTARAIADWKPIPRSPHHLCRRLQFAPLRLALFRPRER